MGFFASFWSWLNGQLAGYIGLNTARVAEALEPAVVTLATLYVMVWGYLHLTGRIEEPFVTGLKRLITLAVVLGSAVHLWLYNTLIVDTFYNAPAQLAASVVGTPTRWRPSMPSGTVVARWRATCGTTAECSAAISATTSPARCVWALVGLLCVYTMFLIALSRIALAVLLALGPLFLALLLFDATRRFFEAWLAQLANYALITVLTVLVAALLLQVVESYAEQTAAARRRGCSPSMRSTCCSWPYWCSCLCARSCRSPRHWPVAWRSTASGQLAAWSAGVCGAGLGATRVAAAHAVAQLPQLLKTPAAQLTVQRAAWRMP